MNAMGARATTQPLTKAVDTQRIASDTQTPKRIGAPSLYTPELADEICVQIAAGRSLNSICKAAEMPEIRTVLRWLTETDEKSDRFRQSYAHARQQSADALVDEIVDIADYTLEDPNSRRIRVDARKWVASRLKPREYGDIQRIEGNIEVTISVADQILEARRKRRGAAALDRNAGPIVDAVAEADLS